MGETWRMHFVPQGYMRPFAREQKGEFYLHTLTKNMSKLFEANTKNLCLEKDIYLLPGESIEQRQLLEKMYGEL